MKDLYSEYFTVSHVQRSDRDRIWKVVAGHIQRRYMPDDGVILDLGAGYCPFINQVRGRARYAFDQSDVVRQSAAQGVQAIVGDCSRLAELESGTFDVVFASNFLEHLDRELLGQVLPEVQRLLKPGGRFIVLQPNFAYAYRQYFDDFTHTLVFTHVSLGDLLRAFGFSLHAVLPRFLPFSMKSRLPTLPWLVHLYLRSPIKPFAGQMLIVAEKPAR